MSYFIFLEKWESLLRYIYIHDLIQVIIKFLYFGYIQSYFSSIRFPYIIKINSLDFS